MTKIRTSTILFAALVLAVVGIALGAEATDLIGGAWRSDVAAGLDDLAAPTWPAWISAIVGVAISVAGVVMVAALFVPPKRGLNTMHEVHRSHDGRTRIRGRAAIAAVRHELTKIVGVVEVAPTMTDKRMTAEIKVDDRANLTEVEDEARQRLHAGFWIDLGLADIALDLVIVHHPNPPRVR